MTTKSMSYDSPAYLARMFQAHAVNAAGANSQFAKFMCFTSLQIYALYAVCQTAGTSSYTGWDGTATVTASGTGDTLTLYQIVSASGGTNTYGPFVLDAAAKSMNRIQVCSLGTLTTYKGSSTADGGFTAAPGDVLYLQRGTDTTAVQSVGFEYSIQPEATISN